MGDYSRFDRCRWIGCKAECVDEIELCWYHFDLAGRTFIEKRSIFGAAAMTARREQREQEAAARAASTPSPDEWPRKRSVVYYVRIADRVKIGYTTYLPARISQLRVDRDAVMAVEAGWRDKEAERHAQFADERIGRREDFNPSRRLLTFVEALRHQHGDPWEFAARRITLAGPQPTNVCHDKPPSLLA